MTTKIKNNPVHVVISPEDVRGHLSSVSDLLSEQIVTVGVEQIRSKEGNIPQDSELMCRIEQAVCMQLGIECEGESICSRK